MTLANAILAKLVNHTQSSEFGTSGPMGVAHGTQKCRQKLIESKHNFDQIHSNVTLPH